MADINSSDQALNGLKIKSDTLPGDWMVTLVNPKNGEPGENMTIARFIELFISNNKIWTESNDGAIVVNRNVISEEELDDVNKNSGVYTVSIPGNTKILINFNSKTQYSATGLQFLATWNNFLSYRTIVDNDRFSDWKEIPVVSKSLYSESPNSLTETEIVELPAEIVTAKMLQNEDALESQVVKRHKYSMSKMAEAILALQKEIAELKGGAGKE